MRCVGELATGGWRRATGTADCAATTFIRRPAAVARPLSPVHCRPSVVAPAAVARRQSPVVQPRSTPQVRLLARTRDSPMVASAAARAGEVTRLLHAARAGDASAIDRIVPLVYDELRRVARRQLGRRFGNESVR